jgi:hypothetical protein
MDVHAPHRKCLGEGERLAGSSGLLPDGWTEGDVWSAHIRHHHPGKLSGGEPKETVMRQILVSLPLL